MLENGKCSYVDRIQGNTPPNQLVYWLELNPKLNHKLELGGAERTANSGRLGFSHCPTRAPREVAELYSPMFFAEIPEKKTYGFLKGQVPYATSQKE